MCVFGFLFVGRETQAGQGKQGVASDRRLVRDFVAGGLALGHPRGDLQRSTLRVEHGECQLRLSSVRQHFQIAAIQGMQPVVHPDP